MFRFLTRIFAAAAILCFAHSASGKADPELYLKWHAVCLDGSSKEIDGQIKKFEGRIAADPADHLAQAYLGSAKALRSRETFWGPSKLKFLKQGQALLDGAVKSAPQNPRVRMVRAIGYYRIPEKFGVRQTSLDDFKLLIPIAKGTDSGLQANERQAILYYAWLANKEAGGATAGDLKKACHKIAPTSRYGTLTK